MCTVDLYGLINEVNVECNSNYIRITLNAPHSFNGMIYPKGLSKNSTCMSEYAGSTNLTYHLPLRACNTMSTDVVSGDSTINRDFNLCNFFRTMVSSISTR